MVFETHDRFSFFSLINELIRMTLLLFNSDHRCHRYITGQQSERSESGHQ